MPRTQEQSLLRWGIEHAAPGALAATAQDIKDGKRPDLDPAILRAMMGQSDADKMRECLLVIEGTWIDREGSGEIKNNADITPADRYRAWEDLEMVSRSTLFPISPASRPLTPACPSQLVEDLDNANGQSYAPQPRVPCPSNHLLTREDPLQTSETWACGLPSSLT